MVWNEWKDLSKLLQMRYVVPKSLFKDCVKKIVLYHLTAIVFQSPKVIEIPSFVDVAFMIHTEPECITRM